MAADWSNLNSKRFRASTLAEAPVAPHANADGDCDLRVGQCATARRLLLRSERDFHKCICVNKCVRPVSFSRRCAMTSLCQQCTVVSTDTAVKRVWSGSKQMRSTPGHSMALWFATAPDTPRRR